MSAARRLDGLNEHVLKPCSAPLEPQEGFAARVEAARDSLTMIASELRAHASKLAPTAVA